MSPLIISLHHPHHLFQDFLPVSAEAFGVEAELVIACFYAISQHRLKFLPVEAHAFKQAQDYFPALGGNGLNTSLGCQDFYPDGVEKVLYFGRRDAKPVAEFLDYRLYLLKPFQLDQFLI